MTSNFTSLVVSHFGFLTTKFPFRCILQNDHFARWESEEVFVQIHFDADRSFEVGAEIGQLQVTFDGRERPFNVGEVARASGGTWDPFRGLYGQDADSLNRSLKEIADVLRTNGIECLRSRQSAFDTLARQRERECDIYARQQVIKRMKEFAEKAWKERDYSKVVDLYNNVDWQLNPVEAKRFEFARKRMSLG